MAAVFENGKWSDDSEQFSPEVREWVYDWLRGPGGERFHCPRGRDSDQYVLYFDKRLFIGADLCMHAIARVAGTTVEIVFPPVDSPPGRYGFPWNTVMQSLPTIKERKLAGKYGQHELGPGAPQYRRFTRRDCSMFRSEEVPPNLMDLSERIIYQRSVRSVVLGSP
jgi:hypothetical protein